MIFGGSPFFDALGIFVIAAALTVLLARWLRLPSLVSYIAAGLLIGPITGLIGPGTTAPEALDLLGRTRTDDLDEAGRIITGARAEVEAIEKAATVLESESLGDWVYDVCDRAAEEPPFTGDIWEHPRVVAYCEAAQVITTIAKESK